MNKLTGTRNIRTLLSNSKAKLTVPRIELQTKLIQLEHHAAFCSLPQMSWTYTSFLNCRRSEGRVSRHLPLHSHISTSSQRLNLPSLHDFDLRTLPGADDFISTLDKQQRDILLGRLQRDDTKRKQQLEAGDVEVNAPISKAHLRQMFLFEAVPFVGFGFLDNVIMILCGDYIDMKFGAMLGISTLAAAGFGNLVSDVCGLGTAGYVEAVASRMGLHMPPLTPEQIETAPVRWASFWGRTLGVTIGCLLGMFPLFFIESRSERTERCERERVEKEAEEKETAAMLILVKD